MNCEKYLILIDDLVEGELDSHDAEKVNTHILSCPECDSAYTLLKEEKELYTQYLFSAEPSPDLWNDLQAKIEEASPLPLSENAAASSGWKFNIFNYFRFYPALGFAAVLLILGFGLFRIASDKSAPLDEYAAQNELKINQPADPAPFSQTAEDKGEVSEKQTDKTGGLVQVKARTRKISPLNQKLSGKKPGKAALRTLQANDKPLPNANNQTLQAQAKPSEEQLRLKALDEETTQQIEKIELLLRSFRNARVVEGGTIYDVAYEKQQARKLLGKNVELRQIAEIYGALYTEELLDKAEPFLLEIANLENNPLPEKVLDIKERVKNQNIIASLQVY